MRTFPNGQRAAEETADIDLSEAHRGLLAEILKDSGTETAAGAIRKSLNLYHRLLQAAKNGEKIVLKSADKEIEFVIL